jgi:hypothetical protein
LILLRGGWRGERETHEHGARTSMHRPVHLRRLV